MLQEIISKFNTSEERMCELDICQITTPELQSD